jgi:hypothetical protein
MKFLSAHSGGSASVDETGNILGGHINQEKNDDDDRHLHHLQEVHGAVIIKDKKRKRKLHSLVARMPTQC